MENALDYPPTLQSEDTPQGRKQLNFVKKLVYLKPFLALILVRLFLSYQ